MKMCELKVKHPCRLFYTYGGKDILRSIREVDLQRHIYRRGCEVTELTEITTHDNVINYIITVKYTAEETCK